MRRARLLLFSLGLFRRCHSLCHLDLSGALFVAFRAIHDVYQFRPSRGNAVFGAGGVSVECEELNLLGGSSFCFSIGCCPLRGGCSCRVTCGWVSWVLPDQGDPDSFVVFPSQGKRRRLDCVQGVEINCRLYASAMSLLNLTYH